MKAKIDDEIRDLTLRLKMAIAKKKGGKTSQESIVKYHKRVNQEQERFNDMVYRFPCPRCGGRNTKRSGLTTQIEIKCRLTCLDCQIQRDITKDTKITSFFVLSNKQVKDIIENDLTLTKEKKDFFLYKYLIKQKN